MIGRVVDSLRSRRAESAAEPAVPTDRQESPRPLEGTIGRGPPVGHVSYPGIPAKADAPPLTRERDYIERELQTLQREEVCLLEDLGGAVRHGRSKDAAAARRVLADLRERKEDLEAALLVVGREASGRPPPSRPSSRRTK